MAQAIARITVSLPVALASHLAQAARETGQTQTAIVCAALAAHLATVSR